MFFTPWSKMFHLCKWTLKVASTLCWWFGLQEIHVEFGDPFFLKKTFWVFVFSNQWQQKKRKVLRSNFCTPILKLSLNVWPNPFVFVSVTFFLVDCELIIMNKLKKLNSMSFRTTFICFHVFIICFSGLYSNFFFSPSHGNVSFGFAFFLGGGSRFGLLRWILFQTVINSLKTFCHTDFYFD